MRRAGIILAAMVLSLGLVGCSKRELEDRTFPTVLVVRDADIEKEQAEKQTVSTNYIDYGHVKAVIFSEAVLRDSESLKNVLLYLEERPVFANNILIFAGDGEVLEKASNTEGKTGMYLEAMYKNQPKGAQFPETVLKDMLNYLHNSEDSIQVPYLEVEDGNILPTEQLELTQEAAPAMNMPVLRKTDE